MELRLEVKLPSILATIVADGTPEEIAITAYAVEHAAVVLQGLYDQHEAGEMGFASDSECVSFIGIMDHNLLRFFGGFLMFETQFYETGKREFPPSEPIMGISCVLSLKEGVVPVHALIENQRKEFFTVGFYRV